MLQPPLLPEETLHRVQRVARLDGMGALALGAIFALTAAAAGEFSFTVIGLLAAGAGAIELHGLTLLQRGEARGMNWLVASQPFLLFVVFVYCALRLWLVELPPIPESFRALFETSAQQWGMSVAEYQHALNRITLLAVAVVASGFQGAMTLYYLRRRKVVAEALAVEDE